MDIKNVTIDALKLMEAEETYIKTVIPYVTEADDRLEYKKEMLLMIISIMCDNINNGWLDNVIRGTEER